MTMTEFCKPFWIVGILFFTHTLAYLWGNWNGFIEALKPFRGKKR